MHCHIVFVRKIIFPKKLELVGRLADNLYIKIPNTNKGNSKTEENFKSWAMQKQAAEMMVVLVDGFLRYWEKEKIAISAPKAAPTSVVT